MTCVADMICDSVNSFNCYPFLPRYLIFLMTRKMGSLILRGLFVHSVSTILMLLWMTKLIVNVEAVSTLYNYKCRIFTQFKLLILFSPLVFMQLHLGCMIWDRVDILKRKKWVILSWYIFNMYVKLGCQSCLYLYYELVLGRERRRKKWWNPTISPFVTF